MTSRWRLSERDESETDFRDLAYIRRPRCEIEGLLLDDRLKEEDRQCLHGAAQALRNVLDASTWAVASQTFYRVGERPREAGSVLVH